MAAAQLGLTDGPGGPLYLPCDVLYRSYARLALRVKEADASTSDPWPLIPAPHPALSRGAAGRAGGWCVWS